MLNRLVDPAKKYPDSPSSSHDWSDLTIHWERDEYQGLVNHRTHSWPDVVSHKPLKMIKNRSVSLFIQLIDFEAYYQELLYFQCEVSFIPHL